MVKFTITRTIEIPDVVKLERYRRLPELGPKILFFSGGSALKKLSQHLIHYTHNSIHLITPFDSGGSSAVLRKAFAMIAVGDLRNRLMALADQSVRGAPDIYELFAMRFAQHSNEVLKRELDDLVKGRHPLMQKVSHSMRKIIRYNLQFFAKKMPESFPLQGANIGNLILTGGYLNYSRNIDAVIFLFAKLVEARGIVRPIIGSNYHLAADLEDGQTLIGQHIITGKETPAITSPIKRVYLTKSLENKEQVYPTIPGKIKKTIKNAELICYPMGSFYSSLVAHFLPKHTARAIAQNSCPKIFILNYGKDPEQLGMTPSSMVKTLLSYLQRDFSQPIPVDKLLNFVVLDSSSRQYPNIEREIQTITNMGIQVIDTSLIGKESKPLIDATKLIDILLSFTQVKKEEQNMGKSWTFKSAVNRKELSGILRDLANSIEHGKVVLENDDSFVSFELGDDLTFAVEAEQKKEREKFSVEVRWFKQAKKKIQDFKISSTEPEVTEDENTESTGETQGHQ